MFIPVFLATMGPSLGRLFYGFIFRTALAFRFLVPVIEGDQVSFSSHKLRCEFVWFGKKAAREQGQVAGLV